MVSFSGKRLIAVLSLKYFLGDVQFLYSETNCQHERLLSPTLSIIASRYYKASYKSTTRDDVTSVLQSCKSGFLLHAR